MNPFIYPKGVHQRTYTPRQYKRYQSYKRMLRLEFMGKCIYCQMPSSLRGYESFGVDHYRPQKHFPELARTYSNLFYCCNACNSTKGSYWPHSAEEKTHFIPNPCEHRMFDHLRFKGGVIESRTMAGYIALKVMDLNDPQAVDYRNFVLSSIDVFEEKKSVLLAKRAKAQTKMKTGAMPHAVASQAMAEIDLELGKVAQALKILSGDPK